MKTKPIIIVMGPTASGKTDLAINIAMQGEFEIINADAMQVYSEIPIITAQPTALERKSIPHWLFGYQTGNIIYSVAQWLDDAISQINDIHARNKIPILVGGTGMYIKALIDGLSQIPNITAEIRSQCRDLFQKLGKDNFYELLIKTDPKIIGKIRPSDTQRMIRAFEVFTQTNLSIIDWQAKPTDQYFSKDSFLLIQTDLPRPILHRKINERFVLMVENGAIDEAKYVMENYDYGALPINKAHGIPEFKNYLMGLLTLPQAIERAQIVTRQYAKRQITWLRHKMEDIQKIYYQSPDNLNSLYKAVRDFCQI